MCCGRNTRTASRPAKNTSAIDDSNRPADTRFKMVSKTIRFIARLLDRKEQGEFQEHCRNLQGFGSLVCASAGGPRPAKREEEAGQGGQGDHDDRVLLAQ